jgi:hypothetical protein
MTARFYVYSLDDPRSGLPFYIGKGRANRAWQHLSGADRINLRKAARIDEIRAAGLEPRVTIVARYEFEGDAYDRERELIASHSGLTNIMAGHGWRITREEAARREAQRQERIGRERAASVRDYLRKMLKLWDSFPNGVTFPNLKNGDALASEYISMVRSIAYPASPN